MNYRDIKIFAKDMKLKVKDLIALAPQNDPFYCGSRSEVAKAEWFTTLWERFGGRGAHIRRIHYRAQAQETALLKPDSLPYENTVGCWGYLCQAAKYARYLALVPASDFVDRRNEPPIVHAKWYKLGDWDYTDPTPGYHTQDDGWESYILPELPRLGELPYSLPDLPDFKVTGYTSEWGGKIVQQDYHVELWAEKTGVDDVLVPLCKHYGLNLVRGKGELSVTTALDFLERVRDADRPGRILYVSDYDPAGLGMPISVARKLEFFQREFGFDDLDVMLEPLVLTAKQVREHDLPRKPVKDSDKRKASWIATQGAGQVELDALEALHPGVLAGIVKTTLLTYYDETLAERARDQRDELERMLEDERQEIIDTHQDEIDALEHDYDSLRDMFSATQTQFSEMVAQFQAEIDAHGAKMQDIRERGQELHGRLLEEMADVDVDVNDFPLPDPDLLIESNALLYDSDRSYFNQLEFYKDYRAGTRRS